MIKRFKVWFNRKTIEEKILFVVPAVIVAGTLLALFFVILSKQEEKREDISSVTGEKVESQWVLNAMYPDKEVNPVIFDWVHNCLGMHAIENAIPPEDFVLLVFYGDDSSKFAMDYYMDISSEDDIYPIYGRGIILEHLDERETQEMAIWRQNNLPTAEEVLDGSDNTEKYYFYICDPSMYDFYGMKLTDTTIFFDAFDSSKPVEDLGASSEALQSQSYMEAYTHSYGIPTEWLRVGRANGKNWCKKVKDADLPIFDEYNYLEKIYCIKKDDWEKLQNYSLEKRNNYMNKFIIGKTDADGNFRTVTLNGDGCFALYGINDLGVSEVDYMLDEQGYISLEESKQFMQMYIAYAYGIGDDLR